MNIEIASQTKSVGDFYIRYALYERIVPGCEDYETHKCFSVSVEKVKGTNKEKAYADDITSDMTTAFELYYMLARNGVTPITFLDVLEDRLY